MILTRLLRPDDFGIVGVIGSVFYTAGMFTDLGFQAFVVRHERTDDHHFRNVIWTIHAQRGLILFALVALASPLIARLFDKPAIAMPLAVASATFAINGLASLSLMTALRKDKSRELSFFDLGLQIFQTFVSVILALWFRNAWALIGAMLFQSAIRTFLSYRLFSNSGQRPAHDRAIFREFLAFSRLILVSSLITLLLAQSDKFVLARMLSLREFGLYALAINITSAPRGFATSYVMRVAFPVYAKTWRERPNLLASVYYSVRRRQTALYSFGCGGLLGAAPLLIHLLYDPRYSGASIFLSLSMVGVSLQLTNIAATELLTATGNLKPLVHVNVTKLLWLATTLPLGFAFGGPIGIVAAVGTMEVPATIFNWVLLRRVGVLNLREEFSYIGLVAAGALIGFAAAIAGLRLLPML
jgi:O-antigen/teichoic acid export membrane protein